MSAPGKYRFISSDRRVREDRRFVVGKGNFVADIVPQGVKHVALVTCPHPAARIVSIDKAPALAMPGHMVVVNSMNVHSTLGLLFLLNCHRLVYPLTCGGPDGFDRPANCRILDSRQGKSTRQVDPPAWR